ncbi:UPF0193 protein EVG1 homolog [Spodoptera frugiperda]|uniref:UPF0193 protein EVG1 homolog n=1 Tax=Spodoptera frugiperda TaxID=7108 RepID=A0A9R0EGD5_SPOFR|nr:UPF0193 protein EVG1 homolog [Spodoptera frugiperda]
MLNPDGNGYVHITWPSKNIPHGGIFHTRVAEPTDGQQELLRVLLEESKLTIAQRQKTSLRLREDKERREDSEQVIQMPVVRPRTSRRRSLSTIKESGVFNMDGYRPLKRGEDREQLKERLANVMAFGNDQQQPHPVLIDKKKQQPKLPSAKEKWNELVTQIRERTEWLAEMEYLGQAGPHRDIIKDQIAERMRALDALGVDSACSTPKSTASGFSTKGSQPLDLKSHRSTSTVVSKMSTNGKKMQVTRNSRSRNKEENVSAYSQLSPLQYSPRRRQ